MSVIDGHLSMYCLEVGLFKRSIMASVPRKRRNNSLRPLRASWNRHGYRTGSDGEAPLFLSDGWSSYPEVLASTYSHEEPVPYSGRGRPRKPIRIIDENLKYAQVNTKKAVVWSRLRNE